VQLQCTSTTEKHDSETDKRQIRIASEEYMEWWILHLGTIA